MKKLLILLIFNVLAISVWAQNMVITSIQPLYSLVSILTDGTDIKSFTPFESDVSMTTSKEEMQDEEFELTEAKSAQAVVDISSIWDEDAIYGKARMENIHIIEIDASKNYDDTKSNLFFTNYKDGKTNPYVWMSNKNILKMANIVAGDLQRIYPKSKGKIQKNLVNFQKDIIVQSKKIQDELIGAKTSEVISLSQNIQYFLNDMDLYVVDMPYDELNAQNVGAIMEEQGIYTIVSDKWVKKDVREAISKANGNFVFIDTLDVPYDDDDEMDKLAILKIYKDNADRLIKALDK